MRVAIIGAGALGAGFLYPLFTDVGCQAILLDKYPHLFISLLARNPLHGGTGCRVDTDMIRALSCFDWVSWTSGANLFITATPPSALLEIVALLRPLPDKPRTVLCCENYHDPAGFLRGRLPHLSQTRFVNGIAHVCAFTHSDTEIWHDDGWLEVKEDIGVESDLIRVAELPWRLAYARKFFLHNAPHAVIAYNGWRDCCETIPEAVAARDYGPLWALLRQAVPALARDFLDVEIKRFSNPDFPDPVSRVARSPSRKLRAHERLPALLTLAVGTPAEGLVADAVRNAIEYGNDCGPLVATWLHTLGLEPFLRCYCGLGTEAVEAVMGGKKQDNG